MEGHVKTIVCYGDSNTHGYDSVTQGRFDQNSRWPSLLGQYLGEQYSVVEDGLSGRTTVLEDPLTEGLNGFQAVTPCLMTHEPVDLLVIMLGTNDTKERFQFTAQNIADGLKRLVIKALQTPAWYQSPRILILSPLPIHKNYESTEIFSVMGKNCAEKSEALGKLFYNVATELGCDFLDVKTIDGMEMAPGDYMHLSKESHRVLAVTLAELIPEIL